MKSKSSRSKTVKKAPAKKKPAAKKKKPVAKKKYGVLEGGQGNN